MRVLVAGGTGAIGRPLVAALVAAGHRVSATTRRAERTGAIEALGARAIVVDALDRDGLVAAIAGDAPDVIVHQLTDLSAMDFAANSRLRIEGTRNLVDAALAAGVETMIAQSIAWLYVAGESPAVESEPLDPDVRGAAGVLGLQDSVARMPRGVVLRYGTLYGPGTWYAADGAVADQARAGGLPATPAWASFVHVDDAVSAAVAALDWPAGPVNVVDDEPATGLVWVPFFCERVGAPAPGVEAEAPASGRPVSNAEARKRGWAPRYPSWRAGLRDAIG